MKATGQRQIAATAAALLFICLAAAVIIAVHMSSHGSAPIPVPPGSPPYAGQRTVVAFNEETAAGGLTIRPLPETADDGSLVYQVKDGQGTAIVGTFNYIPWLDKNPLFRELPGGDLILGSHSLYRRSDRMIRSLGEGAGLGYVFDYAVHDNLLALEGKSEQENVPGIYVCVVDLSSGASKIIDSFKYPDYLSEKQPYLCWAGGRLYYDYYLGDKPVVKVYDPAAGRSSPFKESAMNPLASPDGRYLALFASDAPTAPAKAGTRTGTGIGLEAIDLETNRVIGLEGSSRLFWSPGYVTVWDGDRLELHIYDLNSGAKVKDVPADSPVADLSIAPASSGHPGVLKGASYHFENKQITREQFVADVRG